MEIGGAGALTIGVPLLGYLVVNVFSFSHWDSHISGVVILVFFAGLTALMVLALLRLLMLAVLRWRR